MVHGQISAREKIIIVSNAWATHVSFLSKRVAQKAEIAVVCDCASTCPSAQL